VATIPNRQADSGDVIETVVWRRLDAPGYDACWLICDGASWRLSGAAVFVHDSQPCALTYAVRCDDAWRTQEAEVVGRIGEREVQLHAAVDRSGRWTMNGQPCPAVDGCIDFDLNFSPATNAISVRRLELGVGNLSEATAAWLTFPELTMQPLPQTYRRTGERSYRYEAPTLGFASDLQVSEHGMVTHYPPLWTPA
jgi:hypothetical protein